MTKIFISYRRSDTAAHAGRLADRLKADFGSANVFMDVDRIGPGRDFAQEIEGAVGTCDVLLVVIHRDWASAVDATGKRRLALESDFVRLEVAAGLRRKARVVPVLVERAELPSADDLGDDLKLLLRRQAFELRDERWDSDVQALSNALREHEPPGTSSWRSRRLLYLTAPLAIAVLLALMASGYSKLPLKRALSPEAAVASPPPVVEPGASLTTDPPILGCMGASALGLCWHLGAAGVSCDDTCEIYDRGFDSRTVSSTGKPSEGGNLANCQTVLVALGIAAAPTASYRRDGLGLGCHLSSRGAAHWLDQRQGPFDSGDSLPGVRRACACLP